MRYVLSQKFWSWGDDFTIKNEAGQDVYFVDGQAFSWGDKLSFQDLSGNELVFIRQKLLSWGPTYEILQGNDLVAVVKKELFTLFNCRFTVDVAGPNDWEARGDFLDHEYVFTRHDQGIARVSKQWFRWTDTYGIEVREGENEVLLLASAVVIDMVCHQESKRD